MLPANKVQPEEAGGEHRPAWAAGAAVTSFRRAGITRRGDPRKIQPIRMEGTFWDPGARRPPGAPSSGRRHLRRIQRASATSLLGTRHWFTEAGRA